MAPQFKKLTDCPENLREAIDWLIQVRHGGDKTGLQKLAEALKKLIEEAIKKAYISFCDKLCSTLDSAGQRYDCCRDKFEAIKALKKNVDKAGNAEADKLERLLDNVRALKTGCETNHRVDSSTDRALDDVQSRLENLEGLRKNLSGFTTDPNPILKQLCTGLETFLGFDSTSKGYTGSGIVYSDLDRLCDAVMAFLHGVLESVKDDPSVTTYYKNMDDTLYTIKKHMYTPNGLSKAVEAVRRALREWDREVTNRIDKVVKDSAPGTLKALEDTITANAATLKKLKTNGMFEENVKIWYETVTKDIPTSIKNAEAAFSDLDAPLKDKIVSYFEMMKVQVNKLNESSITDVMHLKELSATVKSELTELERNVTENVSMKVEAYKRKLTDDFTLIDTEILSVSDTLRDHVATLSQWIEAAENLVTGAIPQIQAILEEIDENDKGGNKYPNKITTAATTMQTKADALREAVEQAKGVLGPLVETIKQKVTELEGVYKNTFKALRQTVEDQVGAAQDVLQQLGTKVAHDLSNTVKSHIKGEIEKVIKAFQGGIAKASQAGSRAVDIIEDFRSGLGRQDGDAPALWQWANAARVGSFKDILEGLQGTSAKFDELKAVLRELETPTYGDKNFFQCIIADLESKLGAALKEIKRNLSGKMPTYYTHANKDNGAIHIAIKEVQTKVDEYFQGKDSNELSEKKLELHGYKEGDKNKKVLLTDEIEKIQHKGLAKFDPFESGKKDAIEKKTFSILLENVTSNLTQLIDAIKNNAGESSGVLTKLNQLNNNIGKTTTGGLSVGLTISLQQTHKALIELHDSKLRALIDKATKFLKTTIPTETTKCIGTIYSHLKSEVNKAKDNIRNDALDSYINTKTNELNDLHIYVAEKRRLIQNIIGIDYSNGVKDLLRELERRLEDKIGNVIMPYGTLKDSYKTVDTMATKLSPFFEEIVDYITKRLSEHAEMKRHFKSLFWILKNLFAGLVENAHFSHDSSIRVSKLSDEVYALNPLELPDGGQSVLRALKDGLDKFVAELQKAYLSSYSMQECKAGDVFYQNCAKVLLSTIPTLTDTIDGLRKELEDPNNNWWNEKVYSDNPLGNFFASRGYKVSSAAGEQDGELSNCEKMKGQNVHVLLCEIFQDTEKSEHLKTCRAKNNGVNQFDVLQCLISHVNDYFKTCHLTNVDSPESPSSVYEMLTWLTGLPLNPIYKKLGDYTKTCFPKPDKYKDTEYSDISSSFLRIEASPKSFTGDHIDRLLKHVTYRSHKVLTTILGHGHARGRYACEFNMNPYELSYPSNASSCFDLLVEIIYRLLQQLSFLYEQCCHSNQLGGWRDCHYGKGIGGSRWQCNDLECPKEARNRKSDQASNQIYIQKGDQHPNCGIRSPLQSFLEDGLQGFLPHPYDKLDCKVTCSLPNHDGIPCKTPMGFQDLGIVASRTGTGQDIKEVLQSFCGNENSPVNQLCSYLTCLLHSPPTTLGDMFAFYYTFLHEWNDSGTHKKDGFNNAVRKANFENSNTKFDVTPMFMSTEHSQKHLKGDLYSLVSCSNTYIPARPCGPYIKSLSLFSRDTYSKENSRYYLSWIVYITEAFYELLSKLSNECHASCATGKTKCVATKCADDCKVKKLPTSPEPYHEKSCSSIVHCPFTLPTLSKYGLYYGSATILSGTKVSTMKRSCKDLCSVLENVCSVESVLSEFVNVKIPAFLWEIRYKFFYTAVALWSLSLLYLLHIMVIRLDLLHIKSHLRSPSSHRIAAQSLLAAGRVGRLAKISYLQA